MSPYTPRRQIIEKLKKQKAKSATRQERFNLYLKKLQSFRLDLFKPDVISDFPKLYSKFKTQLQTFFNLGFFRRISFAKLKSYLLSLNKYIIFVLGKLSHKLFVLWTNIILLIKILVHKTAKIRIPLWNLRFILLFFLGFLLIANNIYANIIIFKIKPSLPSVYLLNLYPTLPSSLFNLSKTYFDKGNETEAIAYFQKGELFYQKLKLLGIDRIFNQQYREIKTILEGPQKRRQQIAEIEKLETQYPYSWQLLTVKAWYQKEVYLNEESRQTQAEIQWLYPNYQTAYPMLYNQD